MVKIRFLNLLRSKYNIDSLQLEAGSLNSIIKQIITLVPVMKLSDFEHAAIFVNHNKINHINYEQEIIKDGDEVIFTHFVGGG